MGLAAGARTLARTLDDFTCRREVQVVIRQRTSGIGEPAKSLIVLIDCGRTKATGLAGGPEGLSLDVLPNDCGGHLDARACVLFDNACHTRGPSASCHCYHDLSLRSM